MSQMNTLYIVYIEYSVNMTKSIDISHIYCSRLNKKCSRLLSNCFVKEIFMCFQDVTLDMIFLLS